MVHERVLIEEARTLEDFAAIERLQCETWSRSGTVPASMLMVTVETGGVVLVARDAGRVVGFAFAVVGHDGRRPWYWSHMAAVEPAYRGSGVGAALKFRQYQIAAERGVPLITWTFDPLQAGNANFNLARLGALSRRFLPNHYGEMDDPLNRGLPSDRLWCEWWIVPGGPRPLMDSATSGDAEPRDDDRPETLLEARAGRTGLPEPVLTPAAGGRADGGGGAPAGAGEGGRGHTPTASRFYIPDPPGIIRAGAPSLARARWAIEIPLDFLGLKERDMGLARAWREASAEAFTRAFEGGAVAAGFVRDFSRGVGRYLLVPSD